MVVKELRWWWMPNSRFPHLRDTAWIVYMCNFLTVFSHFHLPTSLPHSKSETLSSLWVLKVLGVFSYYYSLSVGEATGQHEPSIHRVKVLQDNLASTLMLVLISSLLPFINIYARVCVCIMYIIYMKYMISLNLSTKPIFLKHGKKGFSPFL